MTALYPEAAANWWRDPLTLGAIFTGVIAVATIVSILVNVAQWRSTRKAANAASVSAEASRKSAEIAAALNRPDVGVPSFTYTREQHLAVWPIEWKVKNFGTLSANKVSASLEMFLNGKSRLLDPMTGPSQIFPQAEIQSTAYVPLNGEEQKEIKCGNSILLGSVCLKYEAANGPQYEHRAEFRYDHNKNIFVLDRSESKSL